MELTHNKDHAEGIGTSVENAQGLTLLQDAAKRRQEREHTLFIDVPSWDGDLVAEYRVLDPDELKAMAEASFRRARNNGNAEPGANDIALITAANIGLYAKDPDSGERVAIEDEFGHVGYNRIAKLLGKEDELKSNADAVRYCMAERDDDGGWVPNVMAMALHANAIGKWMKDPSKRGIDLEDILGEL